MADKKQPAKKSSPAANPVVIGGKDLNSLTLRFEATEGGYKLPDGRTFGHIPRYVYLLNQTFEYQGGSVVSDNEAINANYNPLSTVESVVRKLEAEKQKASVATV